LGDLNTKIALLLDDITDEEAIHRSADHPDPAGGRSARNQDSGFVRKHNIVEQTCYLWRIKYGGKEVSDASKIKRKVAR
jgi:hypothetical protein